MTKAFGKVFIAGEYGVLLGKKAVVSAVNRQATCTFSLEPSSNHEKLIEAAFEICLKLGYPPRPGTYRIDTNDFHSAKDGHKLGLGSSAAGISALCQMILKQNQIDNQDLWYKTSSLAHEHFSHGLGSGADVAASIFGGIILFQQGILPKQVAMPALWPQLVFIDTMRSQNTRDFVDRFISQKDEPFVKTFAKRSEVLVEDFLKQPRPAIFDELFNLLKHLGQKTSIPIISHEHQAIKEAANAFGGSAKPSGAGGGDLAIALIPENNRLKFEHEMNASGFDLLDLLPGSLTS